MGEVLLTEKSVSDNKIESPRHELTVRNDTNRKLQLLWSEDTDESRSRESVLEPGQEDTKRSRKTKDANFVVNVNRYKNDEWLDSGQFNEHVSGEKANHEYIYLEKYRYDSDPEDQIRFGKHEGTNELKTIRIFNKDEW